MKVTKEHVAAMRAAISQLDCHAARKPYKDGTFPRADVCKDVNMRYRWDLLWAARTSYPSQIIPVLDAGYKDAHIDTALRSIVLDVKED